MLKKDEMYPGGDFAKILGEGHENGNYWVPTEVDVSIRPGWFYHKTQDSLVRSPENLMELYYSSVGRNSNLLLNVPPDRRGLLHENDVKSLLAFKVLRDNEFANEIAKGRKTLSSSDRGKSFRALNANDGNPETYWTTPDKVTSASLTVDLGSETEVNRILVQEYIKLGQRIQNFKVEAWQKDQWIQVVEGTTVGHKIVRKFPTVKTSKVKLTILNSKACPVISNIELYRAPGD
jgi:alpha-L-fucosidase